MPKSSTSFNCFFHKIGSDLIKLETVQSLSYQLKQWNPTENVALLPIGLICRDRKIWHFTNLTKIEAHKKAHSQICPCELWPEICFTISILLKSNTENGPHIIKCEIYENATWKPFTFTVVKFQSLQSWIPAVIFYDGSFVCYYLWCAVFRAMCDAFVFCFFAFAGPIKNMSYVTGNVDGHEQSFDTQPILSVLSRCLKCDHIVT